MTAALRLARLFELKPHESAELEAVARLIHRNNDLLTEWRPWWPRVDEVWKNQGQAPAHIDDIHKAWHLQAWGVLDAIWDEYKSSASAQNIRARA